MVASILPVHAIVAAVMGGTGTPDLIVEGRGSPHSHALRPSQARSLNNAELVIWVGASYEAFLRKPIAALAGQARLVTLIEIDGLTRYPTRGRDARGARRGQARNDAGSLDPHVWLDPVNAAVIATATAAALGEIDPGNATVYAANAESLAAKLEALDAELEVALEPVKTVPYATFHDAYQYFERRYGLNAVGWVTVSPERRPGAKRLHEIRARIGEIDARCLFSEPQFEPALVRTLVESTGVRAAVLDPLGAAIEPGPDAYFALLRGLARGLRDCLAAGG